MHIWIDADACPVREETYKVALRHKVPVTVVSNSYLRVLEHPSIKRVVVSDGFDAADDHIAENCGPGSVVITADILLADRILKAGAMGLSPKGDLWTDDNIGTAIATRAIMADLRAGAMGEHIGGPKPFSHADRSEFLQSLHTMIEREKRG
ncbi:MAG: YaiI/YqxD family protein [Hellea sp.]|nr:YaiI/YqxD family protein [Hellea sp.]